MADKNFIRDLLARKPKVAKGRSDLYRFLLDNWRELWAAGYGQDGGPSWQELTDRLSRHGQTNARGGELQRLRVREVFRRVQAEVSAQDTKRLTGIVAPVVRQALPRGWSPPVSSKTPVDQNKAIPFAPALATADSRASDDISPEELMAGIRSVIAKRSGR